MDPLKVAFFSWVVQDPILLASFTPSKGIVQAFLLQQYSLAVSGEYRQLKAIINHLGLRPWLLTAVEIEELLEPEHSGRDYLNKLNEIHFSDLPEYQELRPFADEFHKWLEDNYPQA